MNNSFQSTQYHKGLFSVKLLSLHRPVYAIYHREKVQPAHNITTGNKIKRTNNIESNATYSNVISYKPNS